MGGVMMEDGRGDERRNMLDRLFPVRYDFYAMLRAQADQTVKGVSAFIEWLEMGNLNEPTKLMDDEQKADDMRHLMEDRLMEAFTTPFDRQDIYQFSRQMDYILNYCLSTAVEMRAFRVHPNEPIMRMAASLLEAVNEVAEAIHVMEKDHLRAENKIKEMRRWEKEIESTYVEALQNAFSGDDPITILKDREIYHHMRDAGRTLSITLDILHRIIVGIP